MDQKTDTYLFGPDYIKKKRGTSLVFIFFSVIFVSLSGIGFSYTKDPLWPCVQAKVENISVRQFWQGKERKDIPEKYFSEDSVIELSRQLNNMLLSEAQVREKIRAFDSKFRGKERENKFSAVFFMVFDHLNYLRSRSLKRIEGTMLYQIDLKKRIDDVFPQIKKLRKNKSNEALRAKLEEQYGWDIRSFKDRREMMPYFCERPVDHEKRIYFISGEIRNRLNQ